MAKPPVRAGESVFDFRIGPAFIAVIFSIALSAIQFFYGQGQQAAINENTRKITEKIENSHERIIDRQNNQSERLIKLETIVSATQSSLQTIENKIDKLTQSVNLDKK